MPLPKRQYVMEEWNTFSNLLLKKAGPDECKAMKKAFYAGAQMVIFKVVNSLSPESNPTIEDVQLMQSVYQELEDFAKRVARGEE